jgi:hypothetical protein
MGRVILLTTLFFFAAGLVSAQAVTYTGCLNNGGNINKVAIGDSPSSPCKGNQLQISWNEEGPQGDPGPPGICESCGSITPPVITHNAPPISSNIEEDITFTLSDDVELSHFIIQGDASPQIQLTEYFKPGVNNIAITHTFGVPIELLAIVVDTDGNATKILIEIEQEGGELLDNDGDGVTVDEGDCDDNDPDVFPGNSEICDGKDNNCSYSVDDASAYQLCGAEGICAGVMGCQSE